MFEDALQDETLLENPDDDLHDEEESLSFQDIMYRVIFQPSVESFREIAADPSISYRQAYTWVLVAAAIGALFVFVLGFIFVFLLELEPLTSRSGMIIAALFPYDLRESAALLGIMIAIPVVMIDSIISLGLHTIVTNIAARFMGGISGRVKQLTICFAAIFTPFRLLRALLEPLPYVNGFAYGLINFYIIFLMVLAVMAVHKISLARAFVAVIIPFALNAVWLAVNAIRVMQMFQM